MEAIVGVQTFEEDLEDLFMKHKIRVMVSAYVKKDSSKIQMTRFGESNETKILVDAISKFGTQGNE